MTIFPAVSVRYWRGTPAIDPALRVQFDKGMVGDGPAIEADEELAADAERTMLFHYGLLVGVGASPCDEPR